MRITREAREKTRLAILGAAKKCFEAQGFEAATTRAIAREAGIAAGTLFNYFETKEALGVALLAGASEAAEKEFEASRREGESLEEALFALVAIQLRHFTSFRPWIGAVLDAGWSPIRIGSEQGEAAEFRRRLLERVDLLLRSHAVEPSEGPLDAHLFWTLYLGTLSFWANDDTEHQQATLALLDRSMGLYCGSLREKTTRERLGE